MKYIKFILSIICAPIYIFIFKAFKVQSNKLSVHSLINSYIFSGGCINSAYDFFLRKHARFSKKSISKHVDDLDYEFISKQINKNGYFIIKNFISQDMVNQLNLDIAKMNGKYVSDNTVRSYSEKFDLSNPQGARFNYLAEDLLSSRVIQDIIFNQKIIEIAKVYLRAIPILDIINLWWSTPTKNPDKEAAQWWHFDMDRTNWLKFFVYFTDCDSNSGPHQFIEGSHKNFGIPWKLRKKGYVRLSDEDIRLNFNANKVKTFTANSGTLLIENTRGLHRGQHLKKNSRLLLQVEFTTNLFGGHFDKYSIKRSSMKNKFIKTLNENQFTYQNFEIK